MFKIKRTDIESKLNLGNAKTNLGENDSELFNAFKLTACNIIDLISKFSVYEMGHWINNIDRWINNRNVDNVKKYKRGSILNIDLGASNFRYEPSFTHPCVVLVNRYNSMLIVPCSSKKYGKGFPDIIDATVSDGFKKNTGIQIESIRWIHKNRVISVVGKASTQVLNEIDDHILKLVPTYKEEKIRYTKVNDQLDELKKKLDQANDELDKAKKQIEVLNLKIGA